jgi:hypothetical protein
MIYNHMLKFEYFWGTLGYERKEKYLRKSEVTFSC